MNILQFFASRNETICKQFEDLKNLNGTFITFEFRRQNCCCIDSWLALYKGMPSILCNKLTFSILA